MAIVKDHLYREVTTDKDYRMRELTKLRGGDFSVVVVEDDTGNLSVLTVDEFDRTMIDVTPKNISSKEDAIAYVIREMSYTIAQVGNVARRVVDRMNGDGR